MNLRVFELHNPWLLLLAAPALLLLYWGARWRRGAAIVFPSIARLRGLRPTFRQRARVALPALEVLAVLGLVAAASRPRVGDSRTLLKSEGIAIEMVLDRSSSMEKEMKYGGHDRKRIDIVKDVFASFVAGGGGLRGRKTDLIGLTTFARFTEESCPLVSHHEPLITAVKNLTTVPPFLDRYDQPTRDPRNAQQRGLRENLLNATAIGDGLQRAVLSLVTAEEDLGRGEDDGSYKIKGKAIILLTDGDNNAGEDPLEAGRYAAANGIKVYYIVFREPYLEQETFFGRRIVKELSADEILAEPREVVRESGGKAYLARSGDELKETYDEIDKLERSEIGRIEYRSYNEKYRWLLLPALGCIVAAVLLRETWLRSIP